MIKWFLIINILVLLIFSKVSASTVNNIIENFKNTQNLSFDFEQNINGKLEKGSCIIQYPKKIYCLYKNINKKILVSDGKSLVIKNQTSNQYYIYPIEKTPLNLILDKDYLLNKIKIIKAELINGKFYRFKLDENGYEINVFFDKKNFNLIGWQNIDIYQNLAITYLYNIEKNILIKKNQFKLPSQN